MSKVSAAAKIVKLRTHGIKVPIIAYQEATAAKIPVSALAAVLEQETAGGQNVFGHDPTIFVGAGKVTRDKYLSYRVQRNRTGKFQGVGPMQLTWGGFQDEADKLGGCWDPRINVRVGVKILKDHYASSRNWEKVFTDYNGSPLYGKAVALKMAKWKKILGE